MAALRPLGRLRTRTLSTREPTKRKFVFAMKKNPPQVEEEPPDFDPVEIASKRESSHSHKKNSLKRTQQMSLNENATASSAQKVPTPKLRSPKRRKLNRNTPVNSSSRTKNRERDAMEESNSKSRRSQSKTTPQTPPNDEDNDGSADKDKSQDDGDRENDGGGHDEDENADVQERLVDSESLNLEMSQEAEIPEGEGAERIETSTPRGNSSKKSRLLEEEKDVELEDEDVEDEAVDHSSRNITKTRIPQKPGPIPATPCYSSRISMTQAPVSGPARRSCATQEHLEAFEKRRSRRTRDLPGSGGTTPMIKLRTVRLCVGDRNRGFRKLTHFDVILTYLHNVLENFMEEVTSEECVAVLQDLHKNLQEEFDGLALKEQEWKNMNSKLHRVELGLVRNRKKRLAMRMEKERLRQEALELGEAHDPALALSDAATTLESLSEIYKTQRERLGQRRHGEEEYEEPSVASLLVDAHFVLSGAQNLASMNTRLADKLSTH